MPERTARLYTPEQRTAAADLLISTVSNNPDAAVAIIDLLTKALESGKTLEGMSTKTLKELAEVLPAMPTKLTDELAARQMNWLPGTRLLLSITR